MRGAGNQRLTIRIIRSQRTRPFWQRALSRRSQNGRVRWDQMLRIVNRWLPAPRIHHPYPLRRLGVIT